MAGFYSLLDVTGLAVGSAPAPAATAGFASMLDVTGVAVGIPAALPPDPEVADTDTGFLEITGYEPTVVTPEKALPDVGVLVVTGYAPEVLITDSPLIGTGELELTGHVPMIRVSLPCASADSTTITADLDGPTVDLADVCIHAETGQLTLEGFAPIAAIGEGAATQTGQLVLTGYAPTVDAQADEVAASDTGQLILTGFAPTVTISGEVVEEPGFGFANTSRGLPRTVRVRPAVSRWVVPDPRVEFGTVRRTLDPAVSDWVVPDPFTEQAPNPDEELLITLMAEAVI